MIRTEKKKKVKTPFSHHRLITQQHKTHTQKNRKEPSNTHQKKKKQRNIQVYWETAKGGRGAKERWRAQGS